MHHLFLPDTANSQTALQSAPVSRHATFVLVEDKHQSLVRLVCIAIDDDSAITFQHVKHFITFAIAENRRCAWSKLEHAQRDRFRAARLPDLIPNLERAEDIEARLRASSKLGNLLPRRPPSTKLLRFTCVQVMRGVFSDGGLASAARVQARSSGCSRRWGFVRNSVHCLSRAPFAREHRKRRREVACVER